MGEPRDLAETDVGSSSHSKTSQVQLANSSKEAGPCSCFLLPARMLTGWVTSSYRCLSKHKNDRLAEIALFGRWKLSELTRYDSTRHKLTLFYF